jgi:sugar lactone lactonase YvrE
MRITRLDAPICSGGESPLWEAAAQRLHYIDNSGRKVHSLDTGTGQVKTLDMPGVITTLVLRQGGGAVVTLRTGIFFLDLETGALEPIHPLADPPPYVFNDGKVDRRGRFVIGASTANFADPTPEGGLFRLDADRTLTQLDRDITFSNGPCWSPEGGTLYFSDSWRRMVFAYDYDLAAGTVSNRRVFADTTALGGLPDGATVDAQGRYWTAVYQAGVIAAFQPDGRLERTIEMPVKLVSSVMFGGPDLDRLFVTTIAHGALGEPIEPGAGALYVIDDLGARGVPENRYAG